MNARETATRRYLLARMLAMGSGLAAALGAAGCGGRAAPTPKGPASLAAATLVWAKGTGAERIQQGYDRTAAAFQERHPTVKVELFLPTGTFFEKVRIMLASGSPVDVVWTSPVWIGALPKEGIVRDLSSFVSRDKTFDKRDFFPPALASFEWQGKPHALPCFLYYFTLFYNKDLFKAAGLKPPDTTWTWANLQDSAARLTGPRAGEDRFALQHAHDLNNLLPWLLSHGGKVFDHPEYPKRAPAKTIFVRLGVRIAAETGCDGLSIGHYEGTTFACLDAIGEGLRAVGVAVAAPS